MTRNWSGTSKKLHLGQQRGSSFKQPRSPVVSQPPCLFMIICLWCLLVCHFKAKSLDKPEIAPVPEEVHPIVGESTRFIFLDVSATLSQRFVKFHDHFDWFCIFSLKAKILDKPEIEPVPGKVRSIVGESTCFSFLDFFQYPVSQRSVKFHNHFDYLCFFDSI